MRPISPDDDFLLLTDTAQTPMQIGALQHYAVLNELRPLFFERVRAHFAARLPQTPLLSVRKAAPLDFDSAVWLDVADYDIESHITPISTPLTNAELHAFVATNVMERLDLSRPPFHIYVADNLAEGGCGLFIKIHHAVADGVGFQNIMQLLTDASPDARPFSAQVRKTERPPWSPLWLLRSVARFQREEAERQAQTRDHVAAQEALKLFRTDPALKRVKTPTLKLSAATSNARAYDTLSLPLARLRDAGQRLGGTVNDAFLAMCAGAIRRVLIALDDLPLEPLVATSARSWRRPEHGDFGNRIAALHPQLATHIADPKERFAAIQRSMAVETDRSRHEEKLLGSLETPFGPRKRKAVIAKHLASGRVLPGNVTLSNVPGPVEPRYLAGFRQLSNFPTPILGAGSFLNITMRRREDMLDLGIMADAEKLRDLPGLKQNLIASLEELETA